MRPKHLTERVATRIWREKLKTNNWMGESFEMKASTGIPTVSNGGVESLLEEPRKTTARIEKRRVSRASFIIHLAIIPDLVVEVERWEVER